MHWTCTGPQPRVSQLNIDSCVQAEAFKCFWSAEASCRTHQPRLDTYVLYILIRPGVGGLEMVHECKYCPLWVTWVLKLMAPWLNIKNNQTSCPQVWPLIWSTVGCEPERKGWSMLSASGVKNVPGSLPSTFREDRLWRRGPHFKQLLIPQLSDVGVTMGCLRARSVVWRCDYTSRCSSLVESLMFIAMLRSGGFTSGSPRNTMLSNTWKQEDEPFSKPVQELSKHDGNVILTEAGTIIPH